MKIMLGQINTTPMDFEGNFEQIKLGYYEADIEKADVIIFPELSICGYLCADGMYKSDFIENNLKSLEELKRITKGDDTHLIVGYVDRNTTGVGKPFKNMLAVLHDGMIVGTYQKRLLPFYDVFDEPRYFEAGHLLLVLTIAGKRCGFTICEDLFNDKGQDDYNYSDNPILAYRACQVDILFNMSSSPYQKGKPRRKNKMLKEIAKDFENLVYCNQWGAQDELVFDGGSVVYNKSGNTISRKQVLGKGYGDEFEFKFENSNIIVDTDVSYHGPDEFYNEFELLTMAVLGLKDYGEKCGFNDFVIGSSGGIDSAVVIAIAAIAFGPEKVHAIKMPTNYSSNGSITDAAKLHENLGVHDYTRDISVARDINDNMYKLRLDKDKVFNTVTDENIQARARGQVVMYMANAINALALTTGNKTELALGYSTLHGDMCGSFNPIGDMYKMQVYQLASDINKYFGKEVIPQAIIDKAPSAELSPDQTDEEALLPYPILDKIVQYYVEDYIDTWDDFVAKLYTESPWDCIHHECRDGYVRMNEEGHQKQVDHRIEEIEKAKAKYSTMIRKIDLAEFKRRIATICTRLTPKAFGTGRRLPIVKKV